MKQYDIGIDLGTSSIIIATQQQGVIFHQPSVGAVDTRSNTVIAVGEQACGWWAARPLRSRSSALCGTA